MVPRIFLITICTFFLLNNSFSQTKTNSQPLSKLQTWQLLDYEQDSVYGTSVNRAYKELLKGKKCQPVIVAVIDDGIDIMQEDLQGHIWINKKEIAGNGIDGEGYSGFATLGVVHHSLTGFLIVSDLFNRI